MPSELRRVVPRQDCCAEIYRAGGLVFPLAVRKVLPQPGSMLAPRGELAVAKHVSTLIYCKRYAAFKRGKFCFACGATGAQLQGTSLCSDFPMRGFPTHKVTVTSATIPGFKPKLDLTFFKQNTRKFQLYSCTNFTCLDGLNEYSSGSRFPYYRQVNRLNIHTSHLPIVPGKPCLIYSPFYIISFLCHPPQPW